MALRVVLADDHRPGPSGSDSMLAEVEGIEVVATVADLGSLIRSVAENSPDVVLTVIRTDRLG